MNIRTITQYFESKELTWKSATLKLLAGSVIAASLSLGSAHAAGAGTTWFGETADGQWLAGIKLGSVTNDNPRFDDATNATLVLGYQFSRIIGDRGTASVEFEIGDSISDGDLRTTANGEWGVQTLGVYLTYRSPGTIYFKGKLGVQDTDVQTRNSGSINLDRSDANFAYGAGLGIVLGRDQNINLEVEWVGVSGDNDLNFFNIGGHYRF